MGDNYMANGQNLGQSILSALMNFNVQIKTVLDTLKKVEDNEIEAFKNNYDFKNVLTNEIKNSSQTLMNFLVELTSKMDFKNAMLEKNIEEIKKGMDGVILSVNNAGSDKKDCGHCAIIKEKEKWNKRMWWVIIFLFAILITVLGLNLFGVISLPGIPK